MTMFGIAADDERIAEAVELLEATVARELCEVVAKTEFAVRFSHRHLPH